MKLGVHAAALGLAAVCGLYNAAAWLSRRERHLAMNTLMYAALIAVEHQHVSHRIAELRRADGAPAPTAVLAAAAPAVAVAVIAATEIAA